MNPNVNDFQNTTTQPLNHQFIDYNAHQTGNPFANANTVQQNMKFTNDASYAPPASDMNQNVNQNFQPQPHQQGFAPQQPQYQVNQGFQAGFPNATVQMNTGPQVTFTTQPTIQVVQQPAIQVVTQPSYTVTTQPFNNVVVMRNGFGGTTINTTVTSGQHAARFIFLFFFIFIFFFVFMMKMMMSF